MTALLLAARAPDDSLITSLSIDPEVTETIRFLAARSPLRLGDDGLHARGTIRFEGGEFPVAGDRIEAATMIMAAAATGGTIDLDGITLSEIPDGQRKVFAAVGRDGLRAVHARTGPHPGLPTDTAPQLAVMLAVATGASRIFEAIYPSATPT